MDGITVQKSGATAVAESPNVYPLTNRGKLRPQNGSNELESTISPGFNFKGFDWLRNTVWIKAENLISMLETGVLSRHLPETVGTFEERGSMGRLTNRWTCSQPGLEVEQYDDFAGVMLKGAACTALGVDAILQYLADLDHLGERWQTSAVHFAWDGFPIPLRETYELMVNGHVRTRCKLNPHPEGDIDRPPTPDRSGTVYTHLKPEKNKVSRYARFYNMRGPTRCEYVAKKAYADGLVRQCIGARFTDVGKIAMSGLRGFIDLLEPGTSRISRRNLHPVWRDFVEGVKPWTPTLRHEAIEREGIEMLGPLESVFSRAGKTLTEARLAFGDQYVLDRLEYYAADRVDELKVEKLRDIRSTAANKRIAGVPPWPEATDDEELPI